MLKFFFFGNTGKASKEYRFLDIFKLIFSFIFLLGERLLYDFICANLPIPAFTTIQKYINKGSTLIAEGVLRAYQFNQLLEKRNYIKIE